MTTILITNAASSFLAAAGLLLWSRRRSRQRADVQVIYLNSRRSPREAAR
jgi:hypothetical protein